MKLTNSQNSYGLISILLHWLMAALIIGLFVVGKIMVDLDYYDPNYQVFPWWHKSFGLIVGLLLIFRLIWKWKNTNVLRLKTITTLEMKLSKIVHACLYLLLLICCISGILISTAKGASIELFNWIEIPAVLAYGSTQADLAGQIHELSTLALVILAGLHCLAALKHHFINKNDTLRRMLSTKTR